MKIACPGRQKQFVLIRTGQNYLEIREKGHSNILSDDCENEHRDHGSFSARWGNCPCIFMVKGLFPNGSISGCHLFLWCGNRFLLSPPEGFYIGTSASTNGCPIKAAGPRFLNFLRRIDECESEAPDKNQSENRGPDRLFFELLFLGFSFCIFLCWSLIAM